MADEVMPPASRIDVVGASRSAALAGLIAFGLFLPLIGFLTVQNMSNQLVLETRWPLLFTLVTTVAGLRFLQELLITPWLQRRTARPHPAEATAGRRAMVARWLPPFALGFVIVYPMLALALTGSQGALKWIDNFGVQILIYVMLGWGLNIVVGLAGLLDLGYVAFYA